MTTKKWWTVDEIPPPPGGVIEHTEHEYPHGNGEMVVYCADLPPKALAVIRRRIAAMQRDIDRQKAKAARRSK